MFFLRPKSLSSWLLLAVGIVLYSAFTVAPPITGWTMYVPLSTREFMPENGMHLVILGLTVLPVSSIVGARNIVLRIYSLRAPGRAVMRTTLFTAAEPVTGSALERHLPFVAV